MSFVILLIAAAALLAGGWWVQNRANARLEHDLESMEGWDDWTVEQRQARVKDYICDTIAQDSLRWRVFTAVAVVGLIFGAGSLAWIYEVADTAEEVADDVAELASDNCSLYERFLEDEAVDATDAIRDLQAQRDRTADAIQNTPVEVTQVPGYDEAPDWFRRFLTGLLGSDIEEAEGRVAEWDEQLVDLRERRDAIQVLLSDADCPRQ